MAGDGDIARAIEQQRLSRQPVAPGAANFLVPTLRGARQVGMCHPTNIRPVDAHAEGDGGAHHHGIAAGKAAVMGALIGAIHAGVEMQRVHPVLAQPFGGRFGFRPAAAIDDASAAPIGDAVDEAAQLGALLLARRRADKNIRPVEAAAKHRCLLQRELAADVLDRAGIGGGGQRQARDVGKTLSQHRQRAVFRPEMMAPLADAMRLVDGEERDVAPAQAVQRTIHCQPFGRDIEQLQAAIAHLPANIAPGLIINIGVQSGRRHALLAQRRHLILHQRDERGYNHRQARHAQGRHLEA